MAWSKAFEGMQPTVQTDAAETGVLLDQDNFLAVIGSIKCRGIAAGAGAQHENFSGNRFHGLFELYVRFAEGFEAGENVFQKTHGVGAVEHPVVVGQGRAAGSCGWRFCRR